MKTKTKEDIKNKNQMEFLQMEKCNTWDKIFFWIELTGSRFDTV
jgi:hypothetical protein